MLCISTKSQKLKVPKSSNSLQGLSLYRAPHEVKYHHDLKKVLHKEGKSGKNRKQNQKVNKRGEKISHGHQFRTSANFSHQGAKFSHRDAKNFIQLIFCSSSAPDFKSIKLVLARIRRAWIDSTNLALKAYKN